MKIAKTAASRFSWGKVWGRNYKFPAENVSVLYAKLNEPHGQVSTTKYCRYYYVLKGKGEFVIGDEIFQVTNGDVIMVPPNTKYDYKPITPSLEIILFMEHWDSSNWEGK
jgi:mannose-6-phosphate isomerase-like protein (cupin superfamily)